MITKEISKSVKQTNVFYLDERENGTPVLGFQFHDKPRAFDIETAEDLGRLLGVLIGAKELDVVCKGGLTLRHVVEPRPGYWFTLGPGSAGKCPQDNEFAFFLTPAEAFVLTEALSAKCVRMMEV